MPAYNPFAKEISQLAANDLQQLLRKQVSEGWYVEYKREFQSNLKTAHSIAAFANSDGGWFFVGIASSSPENLASSFPGIDLENCPSPKEKLRDIVRAHIQPIPFFESTMIPVDKNKAVLAVRIERGDEGPYVTSDGKIYRRVGEGSDPIAETDRYSIQKLFERGDFERELIREFCTRPYEMSHSQAEAKQAFLEIYFWIPPFSKKRIKEFYTKKFVEQLRAAFLAPVKVVIDQVTASVRFDSLYSSSGAYLLRQIPNGDEHHTLGLTVEIFDTGSMRWLIPLPQLDEKSAALPPAIRDSKTYKEFLQLLPKQRAGIFKIVDGYSLFTTITVLFGQYCKMLSDQSISEDMHVKIRLTDCWRTILFLDDENYLARIKKHGLPVSLKSTIDIPAGSNSGRGGGPIPIDPKVASGLIYCIYDALGCPLVDVVDSAEGFGYYILGQSRPLTTPVVPIPLPTREQRL